MSSHTCESGALWGAASCSGCRWQKRHLKDHSINFAGDAARARAAPGFGSASVSASQSRNQHNFHTAARHGTESTLLFSFRPVEGRFEGETRGYPAHGAVRSRTCVEYLNCDLQERAWTYSWMDVNCLVAVLQSASKVCKSHRREEWMWQASGIIFAHEKWRARL